MALASVKSAMVPICPSSLTPQLVPVGFPTLTDLAPMSHIARRLVTPLSGARIGVNPSSGGGDESKRGSGGSTHYPPSCKSPPLPAGRSVRAEPSSTQGRNLVWDPPLEVLGPDGGALLSPRGARTVGLQAMAVWRHLVDYRGMAARGALLVSYQRVAADTGIPYRTIERLMKRLADASLLTKTCTHIRCLDGFNSNVAVEVFGATGGGVDWVPKATIRWCEGRPSWGGFRTPKLRVMGASCGSWPENTLLHQERIKDLEGQDAGSMNLSNSHENTPSPIGEEDAPAGAPFSLGFIDQHTLPKKSLQLPKLQGDPDDIDPRTASLVRLSWMQVLVNAYNSAYRSTGQSSFLRLPGKTEVEFASWDAGKTTEPDAVTGKRRMHDPAIERWKHYRALMEAGRALQSRNIAPEAWATWAVQRAKGKVLPVNRIFIAAHIESNAHRHIFRQESGYGYGEGSSSVAPTPEHYEQLYRMQEAAQRRRGINYLIMFPPAYVALRKQEIAQGVTDPMVRFPIVVKGKK